MLHSIGDDILSLFFVIVSAGLDTDTNTVTHIDLGDL